jgi:hypothetical protein
MNFENKFVETSIESIGKVANMVFSIIFFFLLDLLLLHTLCHFSELEEKFKNLNLNSENIVMGQFKKHVHLVFKKCSKFRTASTHNKIFFAVEHQNIDTFQNLFNNFVFILVNITIFLNLL